MNFERENKCETKPSNNDNTKDLKIFSLHEHFIKAMKKCELSETSDFAHSWCN